VWIVNITSASLNLIRYTTGNQCRVSWTVFFSIMIFIIIIVVVIIVVIVDVVVVALRCIVLFLKCQMSKTFIGGAVICREFESEVPSFFLVMSAHIMCYCCLALS